MRKGQRLKAKGGKRYQMRDSGCRMDRAVRQALQRFGFYSCRYFWQSGLDKGCPRLAFQHERPKGGR